MAAVPSLPEETSNQGGTDDDVGLASLELVGMAGDVSGNDRVLGTGHLGHRGDLPRLRLDLAAPGASHARAAPGRAVRGRRDRRARVPAAPGARRAAAASPVFRTVKGLPLRSLGGGGRATARAAPARAGGCRGGRGSAAGWG